MINKEAVSTAVLKHMEEIAAKQGKTVEELLVSHAAQQDQLTNKVVKRVTSLSDMDNYIDAAHAPMDIHLRPVNKGHERIKDKTDRLSMFRFDKSTKEYKRVNREKWLDVYNDKSLDSHTKVQKMRGMLADTEVGVERLAPGDVFMKSQGATQGLRKGSRTLGY